MRPARELGFGLPGELDVRLVDERGRAQGVASALDGQLPMRNSAQLLVQEREQRFGRRGVQLVYRRRRVRRLAVPFHARI